MRVKGGVRHYKLYEEGKGSDMMANVRVKVSNIRAVAKVK
jgi:hypothetical protein